MTPDTKIANGTMRNAFASELISERIPISGGDGTSPSKCMMKIDNATALARSVGDTAFTIAEFTGPVDAKMRISAMTMAVMYTGFDGFVNATNAIGAATSVETPHTHRYDCFVHFNR